MASAKGARNAAIWGTDQIQQGEKRVLGEMETGYGKSMDYLNQAGGQYQPYADRYNAGSAMYSDALGLGGAAGTQKAMQAYSASPGYGFQMDQGLQALMRKRAAGGMLNSGNADADTLQFSQGLANQGYQQWLDRLNGMDQRGLSTAGAQAALMGQRAGLTTDYYNRRAGTMNENVNNIVGLTAGALKAGDAAKAANQQMGLQIAGLGLNLLGGLSGMGGMGGGGTGGMPGNMGFLKLFAGT